MTEIKLYIAVHNNKERLFAKFTYVAEINKIIRSIKGAAWSRTKKQWHFDVEKLTVNAIVEQIIYSYNCYGTGAFVLFSSFVTGLTFPSGFSVMEKDFVSLVCVAASTQVP